MTRYCPICAKPDTKTEFSGELCLSCAQERLPLFPTTRVTICSQCEIVIDKARKRKEWGMGEELARLLKLKSKNPVFSPDFSSVEYDSSSGRVKQPLLIIIEKSYCTVCSRASSQYFEAIIQVRGDEDNVVRMGKRIEKKLLERTFIPRMEILKEGIDFYCGSRKDAIIALNSLALGFFRTEKLAGMKEGSKIYRTTLLVRLE